MVAKLAEGFFPRDRTVGIIVVFAKS